LFLALGYQHNAGQREFSVRSELYEPTRKPARACIRRCTQLSTNGALHNSTDDNERNSRAVEMTGASCKICGSAFLGYKGGYWALTGCLMGT